jgi:sterol desaturase/sphingolipid hydroxylase (fatty acid hydroxylase superfamily)
MTLNEWVLNNETVIRLGSFIGIFLIMAVLEGIIPRRKLSLSRWKRWANNIGLVVFNTVLLRVVFPTAAVGFTLFAAEQEWGFLNYYSIPVLGSVIIAIVILDLAIYLQHVMFHAVPLLWRLHRVHHADLDYDVTTGARFHPVEILLSMLIKFSVIGILGPPVLAVVLFEVILNGMAMFNHSNVRLPVSLDTFLRTFVVTPDMHRVHHSVEDFEANSNFGFNLSCWDRIFATYTAQPEAGHEGMTIGINHFRDPKQVDSLPGMLMLPFVGRTGDYVINRRSWERKNT